MEEQQTQINFFMGNKKIIEFTNESKELIADYIKDHEVNSIIFDFENLLNNRATFDFFNEIGLLENIRTQVENRPNEIEKFYFLKNLNQLSIDNRYKKMNVDLSNFKIIAFFSCEWHSKIINLSSLVNLEYFSYLSGYKPKSTDLSELSTMKNLNYIKILGGNYKSLNGLQNLENLKTLGIANNKSLKIDHNISFKSVRKLHIENCGLIDVNFYKSFPNVEDLTISFKNGIDSLRPILAGLKKLKHLNITTTKINESDNRYWLEYTNLKTFIFFNKRHYQLKTKDFPNYPY